NRSDWSVSALLLVPFYLTYLGLRATESRSAILGWLLAVGVVGLLVMLQDRSIRRQTIFRIGFSAVVVLATEGYIHLSSPTVLPSNGIGSVTSSPTVLPSTGIESATARSKPEEISIGLQSRIDDARLSLPIIKEHFLLGVGAQNYPLALKEQLSPDSHGGIYTPVHNVPLLLLAELGILGIVAWLLIMGSPLVWLLRSQGKSPVSSYPLVWLGPLLVLLFEGLWDFPPWATQDGRVLMVAILGLWAGGLGAKNDVTKPE
ncbi:MAG: O-antigen ligase family protein, partial [Dehalococcoidia bacterium]